MKKKYYTFKNVQERLGSYISKQYKLNDIGQKIVIENNEQLPKTYFQHLEFPITNFWRGYFLGKINTLKPLKRDCFIDVCCGTGTLCLNIFDSLNFDKCIAIDNSSIALDILKKRISKDQNIEVRKEDINKMTFKSNSISAIYGNSFLHHLPDNYIFLREAYRILSPGGICVMTGEPTKSATTLEGIIMSILVKIYSLFGTKTVHRSKFKPITDIWLYEEESLTEMLSEIGFTDVIIKPFGFISALLNSPTSYICSKLFKKSMQPDLYWKIVSLIDSFIFFWIPSNYHSHFVIAARKPTYD